MNQQGPNIGGVARPALSPHTIKRLTLSRYYLAIAKEHSRIEREADSFVSINLLHESLETFLVAAAEHLNVAIKSRTEFSTYLDKLDEVIAPQRLPFRTMLNRLNKARVQAKHDSVVPDRAEIPTFAAGAESFLEEAADLLFGLSFSAVSIIDLLQDGEAKDYLGLAHRALEEHRYADVLIECRKALYLTFEKAFDISGYADEEPLLGFLGLSCQAPVYARSRKYIEERVFEPFDYIVMDHSRLDSDLVNDGLDPLVFWNLWRLTPQVFLTKSKDWLVKHDLNKMDPDNAKANAAYVLENTINLLHQRERKRRSIKYTDRQSWEVGVRTPGANIYKKASLGSDVVGTVPPELSIIEVDSATPALEGNGYFWYVSHVISLQPARWLMGYVHEDDLSFGENA